MCQGMYIYTLRCIIMKRCISFISIIGIYIIMFGSHNTFRWFYTRSEALHLMKYAWQRIISQDYNVKCLTYEIKMADNQHYLRR